MPRIRIQVRDLEDLEEAEDLEALEEGDVRIVRGGLRDRNEQSGDGKGTSERRQHERRRGKEIARHLRRMNQDSY